MQLCLQQCMRVAKSLTAAPIASLQGRLQQEGSQVLGCWRPCITACVLSALQGVRVGEHWKDRLDCRQWGAHFPHVAGIAGQSGVGAQSVVLSGG